MDRPLAEAAVAVALFVGILLLGALGRAAGERRLDRGTTTRPGQRAIEGAVLGLFGLLLAFSFSGAAGRYDGRKALIREEVNAIGTAYLRLDLLPEEERAAAQSLLLLYLDTRIATYRRLP